tara:strand:+ start:974 stop:1309 length:336 start_codon:yes stop_codon:yes gene_type:complete
MALNGRTITPISPNNIQIFGSTSSYPATSLIYHSDSDSYSINVFTPTTETKLRITLSPNHDTTNNLEYDMNNFYVDKFQLSNGSSSFNVVPKKTYLIVVISGWHAATITMW